MRPLVGNVFFRAVTDLMWLKKRRLECREKGLWCIRIFSRFMSPMLLLIRMNPTESLTFNVRLESQKMLRYFTVLWNHLRRLLKPWFRKKVLILSNNYLNSKMLSKLMNQIMRKNCGRWHMRWYRPCPTCIKWKSPMGKYTRIKL